MFAVFTSIYLILNKLWAFAWLWGNSIYLAYVLCVVCFSDSILFHLVKCVYLLFQGDDHHYNSTKASSSRVTVCAHTNTDPNTSALYTLSGGGEGRRRLWEAVCTGNEDTKVTLYWDHIPIPLPIMGVGPGMLGVYCVYMYVCGLSTSVVSLNVLLLSKVFMTAEYIHIIVFHNTKLKMMTCHWEFSGVW